MPQRLIPGVGWIDEQDTAQRLIPGVGWVNENASGAGLPPQGTVTITSVTPGETTASVAYTYDDTDQTGFQYRINGGTPASIGASPATITGLTASTVYNSPGIEVRAINDDGEGDWSDPVSFTTTTPDTEDPVLSGSITVAAITSGTFSTTCPVGTDNVAVVSYEVREDGGSWVNNGASRTYNHTGKTQLTAYDIEWSCLDGAGRRSNILSLEVTTYRNGATAQFVLDNTGPIGDNLPGWLYDLAEISDPDDWLSYDIVSGPTPSGGTLENNPDGSASYVGPDAATLVIQRYVNDTAESGTTLITLYDQTVTLDGGTDRVAYTDAGGALTAVLVVLSGTSDLVATSDAGGAVVAVLVVLSGVDNLIAYTDAGGQVTTESFTLSGGTDAVAFGDQGGAVIAVAVVLEGGTDLVAYSDAGGGTTQPDNSRSQARAPASRTVTYRV